MIVGELSIEKAFDDTNACLDKALVLFTELGTILTNLENKLDDSRWQGKAHEQSQVVNWLIEQYCEEIEKIFKDIKTETVRFIADKDAFNGNSRQVKSLKW